jgi:hypothetical protein
MTRLTFPFAISLNFLATFLWCEQNVAPQGPLFCLCIIDYIENCKFWIGVGTSIQIITSGQGLDPWPMTSSLTEPCKPQHCAV